MWNSPSLKTIPPPCCRESEALKQAKNGDALSGARRARIPAGRCPHRHRPVRPALVDGGAGQQAGALPGHVRHAIPTLNRTKRRKEGSTGKRNKQPPSDRLTQLTHYLLTLPRSPHLAACRMMIADSSQASRPLFFHFARLCVSL